MNFSKYSNKVSKAKEDFTPEVRLSSTANAEFLNWLSVTMPQNACNCHQVITDWCAKKISESGADEITWGINDVPQKDFCGPEILNINQGLHSLIGRCFKSACEIQVYPCTDQVNKLLK